MSLSIYNVDQISDRPRPDEGETKLRSKFARSCNPINKEGQFSSDPTSHCETAVTVEKSNDAEHMAFFRCRPQSITDNAKVVAIWRFSHKCEGST